MLETLRKRQRSVLLLITVIVIIAFAWWGNPGNRMRGGPEGVVAKINGRSVTAGEFQKAASGLPIAAALGMTDMAGPLTGGSRSRQEATENYAWNLIVMRDAAKRLEIAPTTEQIRDAEKAIPEFQTNNQFDPAKYRQIVDGYLKSQGLTAADLDDVVADHLRFTALSKLVTGSSPFPEAMFRQEFEQQFQKMALAIIRFKNSDFESSVQVSDDEAKRFYEERKSTFQSPEKRKVQLVALTLPEDQKKLPEDQKITAKKPLSEKADAFAQIALQDPKAFEQAAKNKGLEVRQTDFFTQTAPDKALLVDPALIRQAFNLTNENPVSDVIEGSDGYYVLKLVQVEPSKQLTFDEAKDQVITQLKSQKVAAALQAKAKEVRDKILSDKDADFVKAAEKAGYKAETPAPFALGDENADRNLRVSLLMNKVDLGEGATSKLITDQDGGFIVHVIKKDPVDEKKYEEYKKAEYGPANDQYAAAIFSEWLKVEQQRAGVPLSRQGRNG
jgi:peptidyl-prolyl cis-trans isomerase D